MNFKFVLFMARKMFGAQVQRGNILLVVMVFGALAITTLVMGMSNFAVMENRAARAKNQNEIAFQIAEAGINYYRWHLAHNPADLQDGTGAPGPYVHDYKDKNGTAVGKFSLDISAPPNGSSIITIKSTGYSLANIKNKRTLKVRIGFPSLSDYGFLTNSDVWIGDTEVIHGKLHANGGIRFDGQADAPITSAKSTYQCQSMHGSGCNNTTKPGVWGSGGPQNFWKFPVPAFDFNGITVDLANIKTGAQNGGFYRSASGKYGYHLVFQVDGTFTLYKVTALKALPSPGWGMDVKGKKHYESYDIKTEVSQGNFAIPANGLMFFEDQVWVNGTVKGRATIGSGRFPVNQNTYTSIVIPNSIVYSTKDGSDALGLMAQKDVLLPRYSPSSMEIDAALIAQNGSAQRFYYSGNILIGLSIYGSVVSNGVWTWSWVSSGGAVVSGYKNTNTSYDVNLTYGPPPAFPVGTEYKVISWDEIKNP
ncbi:MAG: hypothetical protein UX10_C0007G0017 [Candidatus Magasanikbacteria bacterium GW2011_GWA2_45_39]|uniref:Type 4 fimbrial biogenesis protein PilX N-terminal domain-containing protein n=2 Tax=Candidatus Magasanikiibacteriota TaxID=1752731 RepID=A0A0G1MH60_9BACT|nr:MAG: hypothetical protein UX10_C0007G0017 [Candidatus Magasanikbacteria bacterium GW2011_GWA2_45_39]HBW74249.1 hypothetical protein [Candidatus Magasanikbacteria bacterium]